MNFTQRNITSSILAGLALITLGNGIASATTIHEHISKAQPGNTISITVSEGNWADKTVKCDSPHPYLVLDEVENNASRFFRHATFNTGDGTPLRFYESIVPEDARFGPNFTQANIQALLEDTDGAFAFHSGHKSITVYCASTLEAAHQK